MFTISERGFSRKPLHTDMRKINYVRRDLNTDEVISCIRNGYVLSANFSDDYDTTITQIDRTFAKFVSTTMVAIDLDNDVECSLEELIESIGYKPSLGYTTYSHKKEGKGNRYRLIYLFETPIYDINLYKCIYKEITSSFPFKIKDDCGKNPAQATFGSCYDCQLISTEVTYTLDDFSNVTEKGLSKIILKEKRNSIELESLFTNKEYQNDFHNLPYLELLQKYNDVYPFFEDTPLPPVSDDCPYILLPQDYIRIKRYWICEKRTNGAGNEVWGPTKPKRIKDGEGRRKKLFINGLLRRKMIPEISFEHLLQCLTFELYYYIDNSKDKILRRDLINIAKDVLSKDLEEYDFEQHDKRNYIVNIAYCEKYGISRKKALNSARKAYNYNKIAQLYDASLTDKENLEMFKQHGLDICLKSLQRFRKDMGYTKYKKDH